jgi:hypothetical protein
MKTMAGSRPAMTPRHDAQPWVHPMSDLIRIFAERGDLAHLALFLWASAASAGLLFALRELSAASRGFDDFVRELQRFNRKAQRRALTFNKDRD